MDAAGKFSNGKGPHTKEAQNRFQRTLDAKTEARLASLTGETLRVAKRNLENNKRAAQVARKRRQARRNPSDNKEFLYEDSLLSANDRRSLATYKKRIEKMKSMNPLDAALYMHKARRSAMWTAKKRGVDFSTLEKWYPNVLLIPEIRAAQNNKGVWQGNS